MNYPEDVILKIWQKGQIDEYNVSNNFRKDNCGAWIERIEFENNNSAYGWSIDKIYQDSNSEEMINLCPIRIKNSARNQDGTIFCKVVSSGTTNVEML